MTVLWVVLVVVVLGVAAAAAVGFGDGLRRAYPDRREVLLPTGRFLTAEDLEDVDFAVTVRGYRMDEVDEVLRRLVHEVAERDARIAELDAPRHRLPGHRRRLDDGVPAPAVSDAGPDALRETP